MKSSFLKINEVGNPHNAYVLKSLVLESILQWDIFLGKFLMFSQFSYSVVVQFIAQ